MKTDVSPTFLKKIEKASVEDLLDMAKTHSNKLRSARMMFNYTRSMRDSGLFTKARNEVNAINNEIAKRRRQQEES